MHNNFVEMVKKEAGIELEVISSKEEARLSVVGCLPLLNRNIKRVLVFDIGGGEFDHHQIDALKRENGITYSSFGLLWKEFGRDFLTKRGIDNVEDVFNTFDKDLIEGYNDYVGFLINY